MQQPHVVILANSAWVYTILLLGLSVCMCVCSVLVAVDVSVLSRLMVTPGFLPPVVMSYTALMKLFLLGHSADVRADALQQVSHTHHTQPSTSVIILYLIFNLICVCVFQILCAAQHIVLKSISLTRPGSITYSQLRQVHTSHTCSDVLSRLVFILLWVLLKTMLLWVQLKTDV